MNSNEFIDYYEVLQLSPHADAETIERVFRHLAKKFHPDNNNSVDNERFVQVVEAYRILADPQERAGYDVRHQSYWNHKWKLASEASNNLSLNDDKAARERLISLLYVQRRRNMKSPGLGEHELAHLLGTPPELMEFHLWYLKSKGWVERLETGHLAITAQGVDRAEQMLLRLRPDRLIELHEFTGKRAEASPVESEIPLAQGGK